VRGANSLDLRAHVVQAFHTASKGSANRSLLRGRHRNFRRYENQRGALQASARI